MLQQTCAHHGSAFQLLRPNDLKPVFWMQAEAELKKLSQVYGVYAEHADNVRQYSQQLWADLDIGKMVSGTDEVAKKLRGLTSLKLLPAYEAVEKEIQGFKNSLPLMRDLKNDALRKRHWDQLMTVTGQLSSFSLMLCRFGLICLDAYLAQLPVCT